jgi:hypothetical protein
MRTIPACFAQRSESFIDDGSIAEQVKTVCSGGFEKVLELVGTSTLDVIDHRFGDEDLNTAIAKNHGAFVAATTRYPDRDALLRAIGVDQVLMPANRTISCGRRLSNSSSRSRRARCTSRSAGPSIWTRSLRRIAAWRRTRRVERLWC